MISRLDALPATVVTAGFPSGDVDALADAIHKISGSSEAEQKAMAEAGKAMVFAEHDKLKQVTHRLPIPTPYLPERSRIRTTKVRGREVVEGRGGSDSSHRQSHKLE